MWINVGCNFLYFVVIPCVYIYIYYIHVLRAKNIGEN